MLNCVCVRVRVRVRDWEDVCMRVYACAGVWVLAGVHDVIAVLLFLELMLIEKK